MATKRNTRTIRFNGIDVDSREVVIGDLQHSGNSAYIKQNEKWHKVEPESICQDTGIADIMGHPIYEKDQVFILRDGMTSKVAMTVFWDRQIAAFALVDDIGHPSFSETFNDEDKYINPFRA